jgi:hypothetical protein
VRRGVHDVLETEPGANNAWDTFVWGATRFVVTP